MWNNFLIIEQILNVLVLVAILARINAQDKAIQAMTIKLRFETGKIREDQQALARVISTMSEQLLGLFTNLPGAANDTLGLVRDSHGLLLSIIKNQNTMKEILDALEAKVEAEGTVIDSAVTLLGGLKSALDAALQNSTGDDPALVAEVQAISDMIDSKKQALADAITANTPAAATTTGNEGGTSGSSATAQ
jgi:hypothetical protein